MEFHIYNHLQRGTTMHMYLIRRNHNCTSSGKPAYWTGEQYVTDVTQAQPYAEKKTERMPYGGTWIAIGTDPTIALREAVAEAEAVAAEAREARDQASDRVRQTFSGLMAARRALAAAVEPDFI